MSSGPVPFGPFVTKSNGRWAFELAASLDGSAEAPDGTLLGYTFALQVRSSEDGAAVLTALPNEIRTNDASTRVIVNISADRMATVPPGDYVCDLALTKGADVEITATTQVTHTRGVTSPRFGG